MIDLRYILFAEKNRGPAIFIFVSACVTSICGTAFGCVSRWTGCGLGWPAIFTGLAAGLVVMFFRRSNRSERIAACVIATIFGLIFFALSARQQKWEAQSQIPSEQLDELCVRVTALRICHERKIMGVFDFNDVPTPIRNEAGEAVASMSQNEKLSLCDDTFAGRMNDSAAASAVAVPYGVWVIAAVAASAIPAAIKRKFFDHT